MFTSALILACLIEIVHIPPAEPLPIGLAHDDVIHDYGFISHEAGETRRLGDDKNYERPSWIRFVLMLLTSVCYIASVKERNLRNKMMLIIIAGVLSFGVLLF
jgi:hypothetical protein